MFENLFKRFSRSLKIVGEICVKIWKRFDLKMVGKFGLKSI
jgi:hypothetical protein